MRINYLKPERSCSQLVKIEWIYRREKDFQGIHYSDVMSIELKRNVWSSDIIIHSRFQGQVMLKAIGKHDAEKIEQIVNESINRYGYGRGSSAIQGTHSTRRQGEWIIDAGG